MILFIDNYDSFTYNLVDLIGQLEPDLKVVRNDVMSIDEIRSLKPKGIVISPGPGTPDDAGISIELVKNCAAEFPIFGVCLGHQTIGQVFGADIVRAGLPVHGKTSQINHNSTSVFEGLPTPIEATRYHSLIIDRDTLPSELEITAETEDGIIMGIRHKTLPLTGVQFHPESILTLDGMYMLKNWINTLNKSKN